MENILLERFYDNDTKLNMEYIVIDNNLWINYGWITKELCHNENYADFYYRNRINKSDKDILVVKDIDYYGFERNCQYRFINRFATHEMIARHIDSLKNVSNCLSNLEVYLGINQLNDINNQDLKIDIELMLSLAETCTEANFDKLIDKVKEVGNSDLIQSIVNKKDLEDCNLIPEKEEIINDFREFIYNEEDLEEIYYGGKLSKRPGAPDGETREVLYKKHKIDSVCPSWLKNAVK